MRNSRIEAEFITDITNGKYTLIEAKKKMQEYEEKYGSDFFVEYEVEKKGKPWDRNYLEELRLKSMTGMSSKQFILHLAEVSEYVHENERKTKNKKKFLIAGAAAGIIVAIVMIIFKIL